LSSPKGVLSSTDYQIFLTAHLIVLDTTNAKYLWKRIPKGLKKLEKPVIANNQTLNDIWSVGKSLIHKDYPLAQ